MKAEEREELVKECRKSGKTAKRWCEEKGIVYRTYIGWTKKLRDKEKKKETERQWIGVAINECTEIKKKSQKEIKVKDENKPVKRKLTIIIGEGLNDSEMAELIQGVKKVCF